MTDPAAAERQRAIAIVRLAEVANGLGVAFDAAEAVRSSISATDLMILIWSDIGAELAAGAPTFEVVEAIEKAARGA